MKNIEVREQAKALNVKLWQIADCLGVTDSTFSRKLRKELSAEEKDRIMSVIEELSKNATAETA